METQTIEITNFGGRLTRKRNGDLNSGLANFTQSWGYDPFSKPDNLTWFEAPVDITGPISDLVLAGKLHFEGTPYVYMIGSSGNLYKIQPNSGNLGVVNPNIDSVVGIASVLANAPTYNFGSSMEFYGSTEKIFVSHDAAINSINFDGSGDARVGNANNYLPSAYKPLKQFAGKLVFGNGPTVGVIDNTNTPTSSIIGIGTGNSGSPTSRNLYSQFNPPLSPEERIGELDVSTDGTYLLSSASSIPTENLLTVSSDRQASAASDGAIFKWNGSDVTVTAYQTIPSYAVTAMHTYLSNNLFFSNDSFGSSVMDGVNKLLTMQGNKAALPNATASNGNFLTWINPEINTAGTGMGAALYYFGSLDQENPSGLYRLVRYTTSLVNGFTYQTPFQILTNNKYQTVNTTVSSIVTLGYGKHYFSTFDTNSASTNQYKLWRFLVTSSGTGTPNLGVYETQTQLFSKKVTIKQIRVYTEPTATSNGFQIDCIGSDGTIITNGTFNYTFAAGSDLTKLQGALERIDFNPAMNNTFALGLRVTNTGTVNMTIKKIEVDYIESGK